MDSKPATIIAIDDDPLMLAFLRLILDQEYHLHCVDDSRVGVDLVSKLDPDLILLDLMMPGLDGFRVVELLGQSPKLSRIPVIIITGIGDDGIYRQKLLGGQVRDFISKPFKPAQLRDAIRAVLVPGS